MSKKRILIIVLVVMAACNNVKYEMEKHIDTNGFEYKAVSNDPMGVRIYTLENGLKIYLSKNEIDSRVQTYIGVRAGSTFDPKETTGLAHYLEHLMFKGTSQIGTKNWEKEKPLLDEITQLFEQYHKLSDKNNRKKTYRKIDSISSIAAQYALANELDKMFSLIGAQQTNAFTSYEQTVYTNNIPANEIEKWLMIEKERFNEFVPRLFHTELETVYEEFNKGQDNDNRKVYETLFKSLFKGHPYGEQTTIGEAKHLKNPSIINIYNYWNTYYVPNNMAIAISGDIDYDSTLQLIEHYFGTMSRKEIPDKILPHLTPLTEITDKEVYGPMQEEVVFAFRFKGANTENEKYVHLIDGILNNSKAGLIDIELNQKQKVLKSGCFPYFLKEYGSHVFSGTPLKNQSLDEVKSLIIEQIEKVKKGEFDESLIQAIVNDYHLMKMKNYESNQRIMECINSFIHKTPWLDEVKKIDEMAKITKEQIVDFANEYYKNNYVVVYKRNGKDTNVVKVEKPQITTVPINRKDESEFFQQFKTVKSKKLQPKFIDFTSEIETRKLANGIELKYLKNSINEIFELRYIIKKGIRHDKKLSLAIGLLPYLGTNKYTPEELQQEMFKFGLSIGVKIEEYDSEIYLTGLQKYFKEGVDLLEHIIANIKPDKEIYEKYIENILKKREDERLNKKYIMDGMIYYAKYGKLSPFTDIIQEEEIRKIKAEELTQMIKELSSFEHEVMFYGKENLDEVSKTLVKHKIPETFKKIEVPKKYPQLDITKNEIFFINYDMIQAHIFLVTKDQLFQTEILPYRTLYNEFFGIGLSSIVFQELREARAFAYTAYSNYLMPKYNDENFYVQNFIGTSPDKMNDAIAALNTLTNKMPKVQKQFQYAKNSILKKIESERITNLKIFDTYKNNKNLNINYDYRENQYNKIKEISIDDFEKYFNTHITNQKYKYLIIGNKKDIDFKSLEKLGDVHELQLENIF